MAAMKKIVFALLSIMVFSSCDKEDPNSPDNILNGTWEKIEIVTPHLGTKLSKDEIGYSEEYEFFRNGTFTKFNSKTGLTFSGNFKFEAPGENQVDEIRTYINLYFPLSYSQTQELAEDVPCWTCVNLGPYFYGWGPTERMILYTNNSLVNPGPCCFKDLPIYYYSKK
jgi:hypothetical protein